jgi:hypothetical protein
LRGGLLSLGLRAPHASLETGPTASAVAGALLGGAATAASSGLRRGGLGALLWGAVGYGLDAGAGRAQAWREAEGRAVRAERALLARLTSAEQAEWDATLVKARGARVEAAATTSSKTAGMLQALPTLEGFVAAAEARRGVVAPSPPPTTPAAGVASAGPASTAAAAPPTATGPTSRVSPTIGDVTAEDAEAARWWSWLPVQRGGSGGEVRLAKLRARLRELDEALGIPQEQTDADAAAALAACPGLGEKKVRRLMAALHTPLGPGLRGGGGGGGGGGGAAIAAGGGAAAAAANAAGDDAAAEAAVAEAAEAAGSTSAEMGAGTGGDAVDAAGAVAAPAEED